MNDKVEIIILARPELFRRPAITTVSSCCSAYVNTDTLTCSDCKDHCGCVCTLCDKEWWEPTNHDCKEN
jgi:hypothetical protein